MMPFDFYSIGHSNIPAERFVALLQAYGVNAIADVRSMPVSRFCPWFSARNLAPLLARNGIDYLPYGDTLGGRPCEANLYCEGVADYEAMARQPAFAAGLDRLLADVAQSRAKSGETRRICLMCAERDPLDCHRCVLVARTLAERGFGIGHILHDGAIEPHGATEQRLLKLDGDGGDLFVTGDLLTTRLEERLAAAYRRRARAVAYRSKAKPTTAKTVAKSR